MHTHCDARGRNYWLDSLFVHRCQGLSAASLLLKSRFLPFWGYPSPGWNIFTPKVPSSGTRGWYRQTQNWTGYPNIDMACTVNCSKIFYSRLKSKNTQKHVVGGGFPPKTRGRIIFTPMPYRYSSSLIFCRNLHTKFEALAPREPRDTLFCMLGG